ncbi:hypothetical protein ES703_79971 [subsurface metagenome]
MVHDLSSRYIREILQTWRIVTFNPHNRCHPCINKSHDLVSQARPIELRELLVGHEASTALMQPYRRKRHSRGPGSSDTYRYRDGCHLFNRFEQLVRLSVQVHYDATASPECISNQVIRCICQSSIGHGEPHLLESLNFFTEGLVPCS